MGPKTAIVLIRKTDYNRDKIWRKEHLEHLMKIKKKKKKMVIYKPRREVSD